MLKTMQKLRSRKGLTLVEVMIATVIFSVILVAVFSLLDPITRIANMVKSNADVTRVSRSGQAYITSRLRNALSIDMYIGTSDVSTLGATMNTFRDEHAGSNPQALIIRRVQAPGTTDPDEYYTYIYNVRMNAVPDFAGFNDAALEEWRVFNTSYYAGLNLEFNLQISQENEFLQRRGSVYLLSEIDAYDGPGTDNLIVANGTSEAITQLAWIGFPYQGAQRYPKAFVTHVGGAGTCTPMIPAVPADPLNGIAGSPAVSPVCNCPGEYIILYSTSLNLAHNVCPTCGSSGCAGCVPCAVCLRASGDCDCVACPGCNATLLVGTSCTNCAACGIVGSSGLPCSGYRLISTPGVCTNPTCPD